MQSSRLRQCSDFTLLWTGNRGLESEPLNLFPTRNFKTKLFIWKTCVISSHAALHFIYVLILSEISKTACSISRRYLSIDHNINKYISKSLDDSINSQFTIDRSIERNSQSFKKLKNFTTKFLDDSIDSRFLFDQSKGIFDCFLTFHLNKT